MNPQVAALLERHFDLALAAPKGIQKLRELILTLAMRGKLVPQNPNDPPASELLKEIEAEKKRLVKEGKIKAQKPLAAVMVEEMPYVLPKGWEWVRFGDISQHNSGKTLDTGRNIGELRNYITTSNLYWGRFDLNNVRQMPIQESELERCCARKNDLLICEGGEAGRAAVWMFDSEICFQNHIHRVRFYGNIEPVYGYRFFEKLNATGEISQYRKGVAISNMSSKALASIIFPLPPLPEQHRIVAKIDQLMSRCDALEKLRTEREQKRTAIHAAALHALLNAQEAADFHAAAQFISEHFSDLYTVRENVAELRKAILQLAVMGKLVPQNPNDPPASELLKEIEAEKKRLVKEGKIKAQKPLPTVSEEEKPYALPQGWEWVRLGDIGVVNPRNKSDDDLDAGFVPMPLIFSAYGAIHKFDTKKWGNIKKGYTHFANGDVGLAKITPCFENAKSCIFRELPNGIGAGTTELHIFRDEFGAVFSEYLLAYLKNPKYIAYGASKMTGSAGQKRVPTDFFMMNPFPLPPLPEQHRIVAKIDHLMALCDSLEQQIDASAAKRTALLNALLHDFPQKQAKVIDLAAYRAAIGCYVVRKAANSPYFGRTAAAKVMYLAQAHVGLKLDLHPLREAAGPLDKWIYDFEQQAQSKGWFEVHEKTLATGKKKMAYRCLSALAAPATEAESLMSARQQTEFDRLIHALADKKTEEVEIIATLFAVWNDFLIDGACPTDAQIITEMRENWHTRKSRFTPTELNQWLAWLRREKFVPQGRSPRTVQQSKLQFS